MGTPVLQKSSNHRFVSTNSFSERQEFIDMVQLQNHHHPPRLPGGYMGFDGYVGFDSGLQSITSLVGGGGSFDQFYSGITPHEKRQRISPPSHQNFYTSQGHTTIRDTLATAAAHARVGRSRGDDMTHLESSSSFVSTIQRGRNEQGLSEVLQRFTAPTFPQFDGPQLLFAAPEPENSSTSNLRPLEGGWPLNVKGFSSLCSIKSSLVKPDANTMEQLLVHCAQALESNDVTVAQQIMFLLSTIASAEGDPNQRVTSCFFKALVRRAGRIIPDLSPLVPVGVGRKSKVMSAVEYAGMIDITPWYRFGFKAANGAMMEAFEHKEKVHIIDFSTTYGMQWPTLIESLSERPDGPPQVRLTVHKARPSIPPYLGMTEEEIATKLIQFASIRNVDLVVNIVPHEIHQLDRSMFSIREDETTVVNCMYRARYVPDESADPPNCLRDDFLRFIQSLDPALVIIVDEEAMVTSSDLVDRLKAAFNYIWIPFDALDTFLPRNSPQRLEYELDLEKKIENIIACEGLQRIERLEGQEKWGQRMRRVGFEIVPFSEDVNSEVKSMLSNHAAGWGMKHDEDAMLLTWKGHNVLFATAWQSSFHF
ncbi:hypothetical protein R1flu_021706 [Riccia fluitans]|uniref:Uncharacterized protein n=1 Tax=Riccia fluitans TaxID=41844 RepID=A0ABD1ZQ51_9MARC